MKTNWSRALLYSLGSALIVLLLIFLLGRTLFYSYLSERISLENILIWINYRIGYPDAYIQAGLIIFLLFFIYFYRLEQRHRDKRTLAQIIENMQKITDGDFNHRVPAGGSGELGQLAVHVNRLVDRLKLSLEEERQAEQAKNDLITNVSHDLRTPLTSITGYLGLVDQDRYRDEVELRHYIGMAYEESQRLNQLVQDLFEYTRLRNKEMKLQLVKIDLVEMLHQIFSAFQLQLKEAEMDTRMTFEQPRLYVLADGNKLRRVFENLITNAIKYGHDGAYLDVTGRIEGSEIVLSVTNYGESIPAPDLPRIFERFYRVEKSRTKHLGGSGIGLAIAKQIIDLHGGTIEAYSDPEETVFTVRLRTLNPEGVPPSSVRSGSF
ncbi:sensor histidine kinase [Paenibacillus sp. 1P03SA]|uniref:sensor histidine kinase n=1 Tax=Paenibacillus sp. 1P03SA TaxID=3132294 RepID=UPI00399F4EF8